MNCAGFEMAAVAAAPTADALLPPAIVLGGVTAVELAAGVVP